MQDEDLMNAYSIATMQVALQIDLALVGVSRASALGQFILSGWSSSHRLCLPVIILDARRRFATTF